MVRLLPGCDHWSQDVSIGDKGPYARPGYITKNIEPREIGGFTKKPDGRTEAKADHCPVFKTEITGTGGRSTC